MYIKVLKNGEIISNYIPQNAEDLVYMVLNSGDKPAKAQVKVTYTPLTDLQHSINIPLAAQSTNGIAPSNEMSEEKIRKALLTGERYKEFEKIAQNALISTGDPDKDLLLIKERIDADNGLGTFDKIMEQINSNFEKSSQSSSLKTLNDKNRIKELQFWQGRDPFTNKRRAA